MTNYLNNLLTHKGTSEILNIFLKENIEIRFVGGCIRDVLLGIKNTEIDFAVQCNPDQTIKILEKNNIRFSDYAKKYGTIIAIFDKDKIDITSLRDDLNQSGRHTEVIFTKDWKKDALRRDFTFNAMFMRSNGEIIDYFNGKKDLISKKIRIIGNLENRVKEDYLRIFRFYRFLGLFDKPTFDLEYIPVFSVNMLNLRKNISNQKMNEELLKMLKNNYKINSLTNFNKKNEPNILIQNIMKWWIEDRYENGLKNCMKEISKIIYR